MPAALRSGIAPNRPRLRLDPPPEKAPERPCTAIPGRRDHSTGPDRVRPARGDVCRDSCTVPISRPCTTTHGSVRAGSSPCRRGGSRFKARPIGGRLVNALRRATGWSWGATPAPRPGPRSAGRRGGGPSLADSRRGSTGRRVMSARRWRLSSRPTGTVGDDDDLAGGRGAHVRGSRRPGFRVDRRDERPVQSPALAFAFAFIAFMALSSIGPSPHSRRSARSCGSRSSDMRMFWRFVHSSVFVRNS